MAGPDGHGPGTDTPPRSGFGMPTAADHRREEQEAEEAARVLPDDAVVDLGQLRRDTGTDEVLASLDRELVGLRTVKSRVAELAALLLVDRARKQYGIGAPQPNLHMSFTGNPGTGKTTVALRMAGLLHGLGYLRKGHLVAVGRDDLVGEYVGHTAPKTTEVIKRAMGGVLFIDEAYYLYKADNERDYGQESIEILLQVMENNRDDLVVVLAGYADRMDTFFRANPGMSSRIAHHITFPDYEIDELEAIASLMAADLGYHLSDSAAEVFRALPGTTPGAAVVRQRPQRAQRLGACPTAAGAKAARRSGSARGPEGTHDAGGRRLQHQPGLRGRSGRCRSGGPGRPHLSSNTPPVVARPAASLVAADPDGAATGASTRGVRRRG